MKSDSKMPHANRVRWGGLAGILTGAMAIALAPLATTAAVYEAWAGGWGRPPRGWVAAVGSTLWPLLTFASPPKVYQTYGRAFFFVFLFLVLALRGLHTHSSSAGGQLERYGFRIAFASLLLLLAANVADYWLGVAILGQRLWGASFAATLLGLLLLLIASVLLGAAALRSAALPRWSAWAMIASPMAVILSLWGVRHIPSAPMLPLGIAWGLAGYSLWKDSSKGFAARQAERSKLGDKGQ